MIFQSYPREVGAPRMLISNKDEYLRFINRNNCIKNSLYVTVYKYNRLEDHEYYMKPDYESAIIDKLFFDFDDKDCNSYNEVKKLHSFCLTNNIRHSILMSGRGYHCYIYTAHNPIYKKECVKGAQEYFISLLDLKCDRQVVGDIARLARIPNTWNGKAKKFCILLTLEQFYKGDTYIRDNLSQTQNFIKNPYIGNKLFDIRRFDKKGQNNINIEKINVNIEHINININQVHVNIESKNINEEWMKNLPRCIKNMINSEHIGYKKRYNMILYFKEIGYLKDEIYKILEKILTPQKLYHCIKEERQLQYLFSRDDLTFPCCDKLHEDGYCYKKCDAYNNLIYK